MSQAKLQLKIFCHVNDGDIKSISKLHDGAFYFSLLDLCYLKSFPQSPGPYCFRVGSSIIFEAKNIYMENEIIKILRNLLTLVSIFHRWIYKVTTSEFRLTETTGKW